MEEYCQGALAQVRLCEADESQQRPTVEEMLTIRRASVCVSALFVLTEYAYSLELPREFFALPVIQSIQTAAIELTLMHNDILSYYREESDRAPHNLVAIARLRGMTAQSAFDHIASLVQSRLTEIDEAIASLNGYGGCYLQEATWKYVGAMQDVVRANLYWSFESDRFSSKEQKLEVLDNRRLYVRARPAFLGAASM